ncbi:MAG: phosphoglycerate mutase [Hyphomonas sp. BRH_c22]|uniref:histidine phosphatase family protein n=1 Tax=Hyphomonas sp. BRH_c22 TaxID=1629710 RepID=UPI0005F2374D|nr:histidine phosphatase family protein [Hyphomonas sp. BRH_c22]KJS37411.1 MAG: phosphoglycerate mutase [Hyphomonas sp. BRH_c22]
MAMPDTTSTGTRRGPIVVSRHGRPVLDRTAGPRLDWRDYKDWWDRYEESPLRDDQEAPDVLKEIVADATVVFASARIRAQETAQRAAPHLDAIHDPVFNEAPLPPPRIVGVRYLPKTWNILARAAWLSGHSLDGESVSEARVRAALAAEKLHQASEGEKVYLAAHGWFNRMLRPEIKKLGWRCVHDGGDSYWSHRIYEYTGK